MTSHRKLVALVSLALAPAALIAGCGGGDDNKSSSDKAPSLGSLPGDAGAAVDGTNITKTDYDHWFTVLSKAGGQTGEAPDPPDYTKCIAAKRAALPKPAKGQPTV